MAQAFLSTLIKFNCIHLKFSLNYLAFETGNVFRIRTKKKRISHRLFQPKLRHLTLVSLRVFLVLSNRKFTWYAPEKGGTVKLPKLQLPP